MHPTCRLDPPCVSAVCSLCCTPRHLSTKCSYLQLVEHGPKTPQYLAVFFPEAPICFPNAPRLTSECDLLS